MRVPRRESNRKAGAPALGHVVDPAALIERRVAEEVAPLRALLEESDDPRERRALRRNIARRERELRKALSAPTITW